MVLCGNTELSQGRPRCSRSTSWKGWKVANVHGECVTLDRFSSAAVKRRISMCWEPKCTIISDPFVHVAALKLLSEGFPLLVTLSRSDPSILTHSSLDLNQSAVFYKLAKMEFLSSTSGNNQLFLQVTCAVCNVFRLLTPQLGVRRCLWCLSTFHVLSSVFVERPGTRGSCLTAAMLPSSMANADN